MFTLLTNDYGIFFYLYDRAKNKELATKRARYVVNIDPSTNPKSTSGRKKLQQLFKIIYRENLTENVIHNTWLYHAENQHTLKDFKNVGRFQSQRLACWRHNETTSVIGGEAGSQLSRVAARGAHLSELFSSPACENKTLHRCWINVWGLPVEHTKRILHQSLYAAVQNQKAVTTYLKSKQLLPYGFAERHGGESIYFGWSLQGAAAAVCLSSLQNTTKTACFCWM